MTSFNEDFKSSNKTLLASHILIFLASRVV